MNQSLIRFASCLVALAVVQMLSLPTEAARPVVPGTGTLIEYVGDDFEDATWDFKHNFPKSSREQDNRLRSPTGRSLNDRWIEGPERGQPDHMQVVPTPAGPLRREPGPNLQASDLRRTVKLSHGSRHLLARDSYWKRRPDGPPPASI